MPASRDFCLHRPSNCACGHHFGIVLAIKVLHKKKRLAIWLMHKHRIKSASAIKGIFKEATTPTSMHENDLKNLRRLIIPC